MSTHNTEVFGSTGSVGDGHFVRYFRKFITLGFLMQILNLGIAKMLLLKICYFRKPLYAYWCLLDTEAKESRISCVWCEKKKTFSCSSHFTFFQVNANQGKQQQLWEGGLSNWKTCLSSTS